MIDLNKQMGIGFRQVGNERFHLGNEMSEMENGISDVGN